MDKARCAKFIVTLLVTAKGRKQPKCFSTGHSLNYYVSAQMIWYYRPFMKNEVGLYVLTLERFLRNIELKKQRANSECSSST